MIIHVTESWGGGVQSAIESYVRATPELEHLIIVKHKGYDTGINSGLNLLISETYFGLWLLLRSETRFRSDVTIHFHSTWAGLLRPFFIKHRLVYSAHCFSFEMTSKPRVARWLFFVIEYLLAVVTDVFFSISPRETSISKKMPFGSVVEGCNYALIDSAFSSKSINSSPKIGMLGRIEPQKNPSFFAEFAKRFQIQFPALKATFYWIGSGELDSVGLLESSNVYVTGWVDRAQALKYLRDLDLLVHTAAWEGSPLTTLEAVSMGIPVICSPLASMISLGYEPYVNLQDLLEKVNLIFRDSSAYVELVKIGNEVCIKNSLSKCRDALNLAYIKK